jgi:integrase
METIMGARNRSSVRTEIRDGRKTLIIDFRYKDKDGRKRRYRRDASLQTAAGARGEAERLMRLAAERGTLEAQASTPTLAEFAREGFTRLVLPRFRPGTRERYERLLSKEQLLAKIGAKRINEVGATEFRTVEATVRERGTDPRPHLALLRTLLREAYELGVIAAMPRLPPLPPKPRKLPSAPSWEVVDRLIRESTGWLRTAIALAYYASARSGEARAMRVCDIDFRANMVNVRVAYSHTTLTMPKSGAERRVPLAAPLRAILLEAIRGKEPQDRLVVDDEGATPTRQLLYRVFVALEKRLGITPAWSYHSVRHAFASLAVERGANIEAVRELMGHADLTATSRYVHATARDKRSVVALLVGNGGETAS